MKKVLLIAIALALMAMPARAADLLVKALPRTPVPAWSWTGFYIGGNVGGAWARSDWFEDFTEGGGGGPNPGFQDASMGPSGFIGGGQIGYDYQAGWTVFGIRADADLASLKGSQGNCFPQVGVAWEHEGLDNLCIGCNGSGGPPDLFRSITTRVGWTVGAGLEYALAGNWSAFLQYNYMGSGTRDLQFTTALSDATPPFTEDVRDHINVVKAVINYRFY